MAMNKKVKAAPEEARTQAALRWTSPVERDLDAPTRGDTPISGWDINTHTHKVQRAWSSCAYHGRGCTYDEYRELGWGSAYYGHRSLFSTEAVALKGLRHALERRFASALRNIDKRIEAAEQRAAALHQQQEAK